MAYSLNMHKLSVARPSERGNHLQQHVALGVVFLMILCVELCKPSGDVNGGSWPTVFPPLQTSTPQGSLLKSNIPISTPRLSGEANKINAYTSKTTDHTSSRTKEKSSRSEIIHIVENKSESMRTTHQEGSETPSRESRSSTKYDPKTVASSTGASSDGTKYKPSKSSIARLLHSLNLKSSLPNKKKNTKLPDFTTHLLSSPKPEGIIKTTRMTLFPTPSIKFQGAIVSNGGNKPPISSPFTGSVAVTQRSVIHPEASPSFIGPHEIPTAGIGSQTVLLQGRVSKTLSQRIPSVSPTPTPYPTVPKPQKCDIGLSEPCICMNCQGNTNMYLKCCTDMISPVELNEGVVLSITSMSVLDFMTKQPTLKQLLGEIVADHCTRTSCIQDIHSKRLKRNILRDENKQNSGSEETEQFIRTWDNSLIQPSDTQRPNPAGDFPTKSVLSSTTTTTITPPLTRPKVKVIVFKIAPSSTNGQKLSTALYVKITSLVGGTNRTYVLKADVLAGLIRRKRDVFQRTLNMTIDSVTRWNTWRATQSIRPMDADTATPSGYTPSVGATITPGRASPGGPGGHTGCGPIFWYSYTLVVTLKTPGSLKSPWQQSNTRPV